MFVSLSHFVFICIYFLLAFGVCGADVPPPGMHGAPKSWPRIGVTVINFSPISSSARIKGLTSDLNGGQWYGVGNSLEHIDRLGRTTAYQISPEWLWEIRGFSRDHTGRLWFSLGQSGRIGTIGTDGRLRTQILVARKYFPDIRAIAFDRNNTLWFNDYGRRSIGRRSPHGRITEVPIPDHGVIDSYPTDGLALCHSDVWIVAGGSSFDALYSLDEDLSIKHLIAAWRSHGFSSIACDGRGKLWFAHASFQSGSDEGFVDERNRLHAEPARLQDESVHGDGHGSIWFTGFSGASPMDWSSALLVVARRSSSRRVEWTLPLPFGSFDNSFIATTETSVWLNVANPQSVVRLQFRR